MHVCMGRTFLLVDKCADVGTTCKSKIIKRNQVACMHVNQPQHLQSKGTEMLLKGIAHQVSSVKPY